jgi:hypothetical protein
MAEFDELLEEAEKVEDNLLGNPSNEPDAKGELPEDEIFSREFVAEIVVEGIDTLNASAINLHKLLTKNKDNVKQYYQDELTKSKNAKVISVYVKSLNTKQLMATFGAIQIIGSLASSWTSYISDNKEFKVKKAKVAEKAANFPEPPEFKEVIIKKPEMKVSKVDNKVTTIKDYLDGEK